MKKIFLTLSVLTLLLFNLTAQVDTTFWFAVPELTSGHNDTSLYLRISAYEQNTDITISQPANPAFTPINITVNANSVQTIDLTAYKSMLENTPADNVLNYGLYVQATKPVSVCYEAGTQNLASFVLKGNSALGANFIIPMQNFWANEIAYTPPATNAFDIVATEDNTTLIITPSHATTGHAAGTPFNKVLNKGQTYSAAATGNTGAEHLYGSTVTSDKPIAITIKDDSGAHLNHVFECWGWDAMGDQIIPVEKTGTNYIVTKGFLAYDEKVFVISTQPNTIVNINGAYDTTITTTGGIYSFDVTDSSYYIQSSNPVYVLHVSGMWCELGMSLLLPVDYTGYNKLIFKRTETENIGITLFTKKGSQDDFVINGVADILDTTAFHIVPGTSGEWVAARFELDTSYIPLGDIMIFNNTAPFHMGIIEYTSMAGTKYSYFAVSYDSVTTGNHYDNFNNNTIKVYPNPAGDHITITMQNTNNKKHIAEIYDMQGRLFLSTEIKNQSTNIDVSEYPKGIYLLKITGDSGVWVKKIVKN